MDEIDDYFYHRILFFCSWFGNHQGQGEYGGIGIAFLDKVFFIIKYGAKVRFS